MIRHHAARALALGLALAAGSAVWAAGPSSASFAIPLSMFNSGVRDVDSASFGLSSSLGDALSTAPLASTSFRLAPGLWPAGEGTGTGLAELPGPVVEGTGRAGGRLGHQLRPPGRHDLRHLVHLRRRRQAAVAGGGGEGRRTSTRALVHRHRAGVQRGVRSTRPPVVAATGGTATFTFTATTTPISPTGERHAARRPRRSPGRNSAPVPTCAWGAQADLTLATNFQDLWWKLPAESESGWGINFTHQGDIIFATWFTYGADGKPLWFIILRRRRRPNAYAGPVYSVTGPPFNAVPFIPPASCKPSRHRELHLRRRQPRELRLDRQRQVADQGHHTRDPEAGHRLPVAGGRARGALPGRRGAPPTRGAPRGGDRRMVPDVRIERTTYRLQGGCSTPELIRRKPDRRPPGTASGRRSSRAGPRLLDDLQMRRPRLRLVVGVMPPAAPSRLAAQTARRLRRGGLGQRRRRIRAGRRRTRSRSPFPWRTRRDTALIGTETSCETPEKRALNWIQSLSIVSRRVALALTLSTISPFLTNAVGTRVRASTLHREIGGEAVVGAPLADGADEIGLGGLLGHGVRILRGGGRGQSRRSCTGRGGVASACRSPG